MKTKTFIINKIEINRKTIDTVKVSYHVYESHPDITDDIILQLVSKLDSGAFEPDAVKPPYSYYVTLIFLNKKQYRLVWLLEDHNFYVGIVNSYRDNRKN